MVFLYLYFYLSIFLERRISISNDKMFLTLLGISIVKTTFKKKL
jgi:hypothetical protein